MTRPRAPASARILAISVIPGGGGTATDRSLTIELMASALLTAHGRHGQEGGAISLIQFNSVSGFPPSLIGQCRKKL